VKRSPLARKTPIKARNPERRARAYARNFGDRADAIRAMPCLACEVERSLASGGMTRILGMFALDFAPPRGAVQAAHVVARGMGGAKGDRRQLVPLCAYHHGEAGEGRTSPISTAVPGGPEVETQRQKFERRYGLDLTVKAAELAEQLDREGYP
jgi:hypothetical protein